MDKVAKYRKIVQEVLERVANYGKVQRENEAPLQLNEQRGG
jgi:hypothetical protein